MGYFKKLIGGPADYYVAYRFKNVLSNKNAIGRFVSNFKRRTNLAGVFKCEISAGKIQPSVRRVTAAVLLSACFF